MSAGEEVFLTGATGFIGSHVLQALLDAGYRVRALVRPDSRPLPDLPDCRPTVGDLNRPGDLVREMDGCRFLVHVAAVYSFAPRKRSEMQRTNVRGTAGILEAGRIAGVERALVTSSSATVGPASSLEAPATEQNWANESGSSAYHQSKVEEERVALAAQLSTVLVLPSAPVGPGDWKPTPTGKMIVDFMRGRIIASLPGGLNLVPVEDVARGHVLALERGRPHERYLIGGDNLSLSGIWEMLAAICGRRPPQWRMPYGLAVSLGWADELRCRLLPKAEPLVPLEGVRMARHGMYINWEKARRELGYEPSSVATALERAVHWYHDNGYA